MDVSLAPVADVEALGVQWRDLEARAEASFFQSWTWIGSWLKALPDRTAVNALTIRDGGATVGLGVIGRRSIRRHGVVPVRGLFLHETGDPALDTLTVEHNGILVQRGIERLVLTAAARFIGELSPSWDELRIAGAGSANAEPLVEAFAGLGDVKRVERPYFVVRLDELRQQGRDYLSALSSNTRSQLRRSLRGYEKLGPVTLRVAGDQAQAVDYLAKLRELHQSYWSARGAPGAFATPFANTFHRNLIAAGMPRGETQLLELACANRPIGYLYNFRHRGVVANYQSGISYSADSRLKPGLTAHHLAIENSLRVGEVTYDFLMGDQRYKANLATEERRMCYLTVRKRRIRFLIEDVARSVARALRRRRPSLRRA